MTAAQGAAAYFAENPEVDSVLATSDGNVWPLAQLSLATHHATRNSLAAPGTVDREDLEEEIAVAELILMAMGSRTDASKGVTKVAVPVEPVQPPTYEQARAELATALGIAALTDLDERYTEDGVVLLAIDAVIATWYRSGMTVAAWAAQSKAVREAAVAAEFPDFITL
ncbi:MAG: hypothetical protein KIT10_14570 [Flavobacteriales bacterium]|nr:hypothetical protein [Flavobacteriales bacterium]